MARDATINVSLTSKQLRLVRARVDSGDYASASELIRESLRMLFLRNSIARRSTSQQLKRHMAAGYKANAAHDRKIAQEWAQLPEAWPEK